MTKQEIEQREEALARSGCICPVCGGSIYQYGTPQYAHKITNNQMNRKKYGSFFIDNTLNGEMVCSLSCNASVDVGCNMGEQLKVLADILVAEMKKFDGGA